MGRMKKLAALLALTAALTACDREAAIEEARCTRQLECRRPAVDMSDPVAAEVVDTCRDASLEALAALRDAGRTCERLADAVVDQHACLAELACADVRLEGNRRRCADEDARIAEVCVSIRQFGVQCRSPFVLLCGTITLAP